MEYRIRAFRKLRSLLSIFKGSKLIMKDKDSYTPTYVLIDRNNKEIASLTSRHVVWGLYNHFTEGYDCD
jgi:hypothetical protein